MAFASNATAVWLAAWTAAARLALGPIWTDSGLVVVNEAGEPIRPDAYSDRFQRAAKDAGLPPVRLHDLRGTAVSRLLESGVPVHTAAAYLGHTATLMLSAYAKASDESLRAAATALSAAYGR